jgi:hypothetical protein
MKSVSEIGQMTGTVKRSNDRNGLVTEKVKRPKRPKDRNGQPTASQRKTESNDDLSIFMSHSLRPYGAFELPEN